MVRRHEFGPEGHAYVRRYLESGARFGKRLGGLLLDHHDAERGSVWAFVPADTPGDQLLAFETGGVFPKHDPGWKDHADAWLRGRLVGSDGEHVLVVEHPYAKRTDGWLAADPERGAFFCGDDVYEYYSSGSSQLLGWLGGATWAPYIGVIAPTPDAGPRSWHRKPLPLDTVAGLAARAEAVVLGAWDDEGWLVWEPERSRRSPRQARR